MKLQRFSGWLCAICMGLFCSVTAAEPALVFNAEGNCAVGWLSADPLPPAALPNLVLVYGDATAVITNNERGNYQSQCQARIDWSQQVPVLNFFTETPVSVYLAGFDDMCAVLGFCRNGKNGSLIMDGSSGFLCMTPVGPTADWQQVVTPSGNVTMTCQLPNRPEG